MDGLLFGDGSIQKLHGRPSVAEPAAPALANLCEWPRSDPQALNVCSSCFQNRRRYEWRSESQTAPKLTLRRWNPKTPPEWQELRGAVCARRGLLMSAKGSPMARCAPLRCAAA